MHDEDDFLPSLDEIFSKPILVKQFEIRREENKPDKKSEILNKNEIDADKENLQVKKKRKTESSPNSSSDGWVELRPNQAVFAKDMFKGGHGPAIVIDSVTLADDGVFVTVKMYDGRVEKLGRKFVFCPDDREFYSIKPVSLEKVTAAENYLVRPFKKETVLKWFDECKNELIKVIRGEIESERDTSFRSGIQRRFSMNTENPLGPFTLKEYNFLLEYVPDVFIPEILKDNTYALTERFSKSGKSLDYLLRQYSYLVLIPEFTLRHMIRIDPGVTSLEDASKKLLTNSNAYDEQTGNSINYLYSKHEMYRYARREMSSEKMHGDKRLSEQ